jgi:hypothetical protein
MAAGMENNDLSKALMRSLSERFSKTRGRIRPLNGKIHKLNENARQKSLGIERIIVIDRLILSGGLIELSAYAFFTPLPYCPIGLGSP